MPGGGGRIPEPVIRFLVALLALGAIVGFAILFGSGVQSVWSAAKGQPPTYNDAYLYVATTLGALVGGIVAVGFGVSTDTGGGGGGGGGSLLEANLTGLGRIALPAVDAGALVGALYAIVYLLMGAVAVVAWVSHPNETSSLIKNEATTFLGLLVPVVAGYFRR